MRIEAYKPFIENMLQSEPWRGSSGTGEICDGSIEWDGTRFWLCKSCGKVGTLQVQTHRRVSAPVFDEQTAILEVEKHLRKMQQQSRR